MTLNLKTASIGLYVYQMKASNPANVKVAIEYIIDLLVSTNDLKIENYKTMTLFLSNKS